MRAHSMYAWRPTLDRALSPIGWVIRWHLNNIHITRNDTRFNVSLIYSIWDAPNYNVLIASPENRSKCSLNYINLLTIKEEIFILAFLAWGAWEEALTLTQAIARYIARDYNWMAFDRVWQGRHAIPPRLTESVSRKFTLFFFLNCAPAISTLSDA